MADKQLLLHSINTKPIIQALEKVKLNNVSYLDSLQIEHLILRKELVGFELPTDWMLEKDFSWLEPAGEWIKANKHANREVVVCHSDFHPFNIIMDSGKVEAVIDWQLCRLNELEFDIASTKHILLMIFPSTGLDKNSCSVLFEKYLDLYMDKVEVNEDRLDYHLGVRCILSLCGMELGFEVFKVPEVYEAHVRKFEEISGIKLNKKNQKYNR
jgi:hypothetical protein